MPVSDHDLEVLADQIATRLTQLGNPPTISQIAQYVDEMGFPPDEADMLSRLVIAKSQYSALKPRHIVVLIHGIRTHADWHGMTADVFSPYCTKVVPIKYDFFDVVRFWLPIPFLFRIGPIRKVENELKSIIADHPTAHISVVAHSFGTYVMSKILKRNFNMRLFRLLLCGAIVPTSYEWRLLPNKPRGGLMNDVGLKDRLPILAEVLTWGYGPSGTYGFGTSEVIDNFHQFGHSGFFTKEHVSTYWVPFLFHGEVILSPESAVRKQPSYFWELLRLSKIKYVTLIGATWYFCKPLIDRLLGH